jgi:hypothetical protein
MAYRPQFFTLTELVCPEVYNKYGDMAWQFLDDKLLVTLDWIRRTLNKPITINTWHDGGDQTQSGLRCNLCSIVKDKTTAGELYLSAHMLGKAADFHVQDMDADEVRVWIAVNKANLPYPIRLEKNVSWVHLDVEDSGVKVGFFTA